MLGWHRSRVVGMLVVATVVVVVVVVVDGRE